MEKKKKKRKNLGLILVSLRLLNILIITTQSIIR